MSSDNLGIGVLIGLQNRKRFDDEDFAAERKRLKEAMAAADINVLSQKAQKEAVKECIGAVVGELAQLEAGQPVERRHSDPEAAAARGEDFIDTADDYLQRLSSGRLSFSGEDVARIKRSKADVKKVVTSPHLQPEVVANPRAPRVK
jgi:hypothetical protein